MFNFFEQIGNFFGSIVDFIVSFFQNLVTFFLIIVDAINFLLTLVYAVPLPLRYATIIIVLISVLFLILGR